MANGDTEQVVDTKNQGPSDPQDALQRFLKVRSEKEASKKAPSEGGKTGQVADQKTGADKKPAAKNPWEGLRIVDAEGKAAKLPISVDGESFELDDMNQIGTSVQFGFHHDKKGKDLTEREKKIQEFESQNAEVLKGLPELMKIQQAIENGTLKIAKDGTVTKAAGDKVNPDHIVLTDEERSDGNPQFVELAEKFNKMIDRNLSLEKGMDALKQLQLAQLFKEEKTNIDIEIKKHKEKYPLAANKEIIDYLAELNEKKLPKYTVEEATKLSHEEAKKRFEEYVAKDPDFMEKTDAQKKQIIKEYLDTVNENNKPPVSGPQGTGAAQLDLSGKKKTPDPTKPLTSVDRKAMAAKNFSDATAFLNQKLADGRKA